METITLNDMQIVKNKITYLFSVSDKLEKYFDRKYDFFIEYPKDTKLDKVPIALLAVPFVVNMMMLCIIEDVGVYVPSIDKAFYECIPNIQNGYKKIYPQLDFHFNVSVDKIVDCSYELEDKFAQFFTGGVDATSALITNYKNRPTLVNVWGGDVFLEDVLRQESNVEYFENIANKFGTNFVSIKSSMRFIYNETLLNQLSLKYVGNTWWDAIGHTIIMCSLMAPYAWYNKIKTHYIASAFSLEEDLFPTCNYPSITNALKFSSCSVEQTDSLLTRDEKILRIIKFARETKVQFNLLVCHNPIDGENCSECEKCYRTIVAIVQHNTDANTLGFSVKRKTYQNLNKFLKHNYVILDFWLKMQENFINDAEYWKDKPEMRWFLKIKINDSSRLKRYAYLRKIKSKLKKGIKRILGE